MFDDTQLSDAMSTGNSSSSNFQSSSMFSRPGSAWQFPSDHYDQIEIAYSDDESDIDTDDSSKYLNRLFMDDFYGQQVNDSIASNWSGQLNDSTSNTSASEYDNDRFIVTLSTPANRFFENSDPMHWLVIARSQFEERMKQRESQLMQTTSSLSFLKMLQGTLMSPVATVLLKLNAPGHWRSCESCGGFLENYCCLKSRYQDEFEEIEGPVFLNFRSANALE